MFKVIFKKKAYFCALFFLVHSLKAQLIKQQSGTDASFRSIHAVSKKVVWAGGNKGTILRTTNGGKRWQIIRVKDAEKLDFRGIYAFNKQIAYIMSAGNAEDGAAKIYKTTNGGKTWRIILNENTKGVFFDSMKFWNEKEGLLIGDPIDNKPFILKTLDGGESWQRIDRNLLPEVLKGEASFAASGNCIALQPSGRAWICTQSRVFYTSDLGESWDVYQTPFKQSETAGIFGLHFWSSTEGIAIGGDYIKDKQTTDNVAITHDAGKNWAFIPKAVPAGLKESGYKLPNDNLIVAGTSGISLLKSSAKNWEPLSDESFHSISCFQKHCWIIGAKGNLAKLK